MSLFSRKGCSFVPDFNFFNACKLHDTSYSSGGSESDRKRIDIKLMRDIFFDFKRFKKKYWIVLIPWCFIFSIIYYSGVRIFKSIGKFNYK